MSHGILASLIALFTVAKPPTPDELAEIRRRALVPEKLRVGDTVLIAPGVAVRRERRDGQVVDVALVYGGHSDQKLDHDHLVKCAREALLDWPVEIKDLVIVVEPSGRDELERARLRREARAAKRRAH